MCPLIKSHSAPVLRNTGLTAERDEEEEEDYDDWNDEVTNAPSQSLLDRLGRELKHRLSLSPQVTCRLCDQAIDQDLLAGHTAKCELMQKLLLKRSTLDEALAELDLTTAAAALAKQAIEGNQPTLLLKLEYRVKRLQMVDYPPEPTIGRLAALIERKRRICERLSRLNGELIEAIAVDGESETTSEEEQARPSRLTTMLKTLLRRKKGRSQSQQMVSSSPGALIPTISDFELICPLSKGAYGGVYLAKKRATGDRYAIKALSKAEMLRKNMVAHVMAEQRIMALMHSPTMVRLYWAFQSAEWLYLVMEWVQGGDLAALIRRHTRLSLSWVRHLGAQLVQALGELHAHGIIHRDLKPDNLLITAEGHLKLTDFGLAHQLGDESSGGRILGTPDYLPPEVLRGEPASEASDWWSMGVCLFEMLVGGPPFMGDTPEAIFQAIRNYPGSIDWPPLVAALGEEQLPQTACDLISALLQPDPQARIRDPRTHPFFAGMDWNALFVSSPIRLELSEPSPTLSSSTASSLSLESTPHHHPSAISLQSTPLRPGSSPLARSASPFDGYQFKNIELLGDANRRLSLGLESAASGLSSPSNRRRQSWTRLIKPKP